MRNSSKQARGGRWLVIVAVAGAFAAAAYGYSMTGADSVTTQGLPAGAGIGELAAAAERNPGNAALWKQLAQAHRRAGDRTAAISALVRAARLAPDDREINAALRDLSGGTR